MVAPTGNGPAGVLPDISDIENPTTSSVSPRRHHPPTALAAADRSNGPAGVDATEGAPGLFTAAATADRSNGPAGVDATVRTPGLEADRVAPTGNGPAGAIPSNLTEATADRSNGPAGVDATVGAPGLFTEATADRSNGPAGVDATVRTPGLETDMVAPTGNGPAGVTFRRSPRLMARMVAPTVKGPAGASLDSCSPEELTASPTPQRVAPLSLPVPPPATAGPAGVGRTSSTDDDSTVSGPRRKKARFVALPSDPTNEGVAPPHKGDAPASATDDGPPVSTGARA